jgi:hypothetical protein
MDPGIFFADIVQPSLLRLQKWTGLVSDDRAHVLVMAIAGQEGGWQYRRQAPVAYARSYWQAEKDGMVAGLLAHPVAGAHFMKVLKALDIPAVVDVVFEAIAWSDTLACCMARLGLWVDPAPLPDLGQQDVAWAYYQRNWRPGLPRPETWPVRYATALSLVRG